MKVGDKVRCIDDENDFDTTIGKIYTIDEIDVVDICIKDDIGDKQFCRKENFELVQEDKLPHELIGLPKYFVVKKDESDPLCGEFIRRLNSLGGMELTGDSFGYYGYDGNKRKTNCRDSIDEFQNNPTLITLAERDRCVNKKPSQTKTLSKPIRSCEHNGSIYKEDTIDGVSIEDMKATRDNINSKLHTWRNLFTKKK